MNSRRVLLLLMLLLLIAAAILIPHALLSSRTPNLLFITIDTLRADYLSCYSANAPATPNIDRLARESVLFENAYSLIPITVPAHSAMFSSLHPHELFLFNNGHLLGEQPPLLAELLAQKGYSTAAFLSLAVMKGSFGPSRGFQKYDDDFRKLRNYRPASEINAAAIPWIEQHRHKKFFAWVHYSDPHEPYIPADAPPDTQLSVHGRRRAAFCLAKKERNYLDFTAFPGENIIEFQTIPQQGTTARAINLLHITQMEGISFEYGDGWKSRRFSGQNQKYFNDKAIVRVLNKNLKPAKVRLAIKGDVDQKLDVIRRNYAAEVQYVDRHVGILLDKLKELDLRDNTVVVLTADHGEGLGTHGRIGHLFPLYREITQVPLLIYFPGLGRKGKSSKLVVDHLDLMPTILDMLNIKSGVRMRGDSLKDEVSWSPVDALMAGKRTRTRTFLATYAPQGKSNSFALLEENVKLVQTRADSGWKWEAYDLASDPMERRNLATADPPRFQSLPFSALRPILQEFSEEAEKAHAGHKNPELNEEQRRMLRDLGYVSP